MEKAPERKTQIIADLHTHPNKRHDKETALSFLSERGVIGLAYQQGCEYILSYEDIAESKAIEEINKGLFAKVCFHQNAYIVKAQEVISDFHILAIGCQNYLPDYEDARKTIEEIHKQGSIARAVLSHPYVKNAPIPKLFRLIDEKEKSRLKELCEMADWIDIFNGGCIDLFPFFKVKQANDNVKEFFEEYKRENKRENGNLVGIATSDAHWTLSQARTSGIYVPENIESIEALINFIDKGNFDIYCQTLGIMKSLYGNVAARWDILKNKAKNKINKLFFPD